MVIVHFDENTARAAQKLCEPEQWVPVIVADSFQDVLRRLQPPQPEPIDAVVLDASRAIAEDIRLPAGAVNWVAAVRSLAPAAAIVVLIQPGDAAQQALAAGADRCIHKGDGYANVLSGLLGGLAYARQTLETALDSVATAWAQQLGLRNNEQQEHIQQVTELTLRVARGMGLGAEELRHVRYGALLHDLGKLAVPESILMKPGPLTDDEWRIVLTHPEHARQMLLGVPHLSRAADIPYAHHERWDGTGYPRGIKGEQIPLAARIFAVVDVWDTLCSDRPYRKRWSPEKAREHIRSLAGTSFDPAVVEAFIKVLEQHG